MSESRDWNVSLIDEDGELFETTFRGSETEAEQLRQALDERRLDMEVSDPQVYEPVAVAADRTASDVIEDILNAAGSSVSMATTARLRMSAEKLDSQDASGLFELKDGKEEQPNCFHVSFVWSSGPNAFGDGFHTTRSLRRVESLEHELELAADELGIGGVTVEQANKTTVTQDIIAVVAEIEDCTGVRLVVEGAMAASTPV